MSQFAAGPSNQPHQPLVDPTPAHHPLEPPVPPPGSFAENDLPDQPGAPAPNEQDSVILQGLFEWLQARDDAELQPRPIWPPGMVINPPLANRFRSAFNAGRRSYANPHLDIEPNLIGNDHLDACLWEYFFQGFRYSETHRPQASVPVPQPAPQPVNPVPVAEVVQQLQHHRVNKLAEPDAFYGDTKKCKEFLTQLALHFTNDPRAYDQNDPAKLTKAISYMRGNAGTWASQFIDPGTGHIKNISYEDFVARLKAAFGDPDETRTAERQLDALRQTSSCSAYVAQFVALASLLPNWEGQKEAYLLKFRKGLKKDIKDMLLYQLEEPTNFEDFANLCIRLDNKLHAHQAELRQGSHQSSSSSSKKPSGSSSSPSPTSSGTAPGPMELDATRSNKRGKLTEKEKRYRRENNLCSYCGKGGHYASACPVKAAKYGNYKGKGKQGASNLEVAPNATVNSAPSESSDTPHQASVLYQISGAKN